MKKIFLLILSSLTLACSTNPTNRHSLGEAKYWSIDYNDGVVFETNDIVANKRIYGVFSDIHVPILNYVEAIVSRENGQESSGYGVMICVDKMKNCYAVLINTMGKYSIWKYIGGVKNLVLPWTETSLLLQGIGKKNVVRVEQHALGEWSIYLNGKFATKVIDDFLKGGYSGVVVQIGAHEIDNFLETYSRVKFWTVFPSINVQDLHY